MTPDVVRESAGAKTKILLAADLVTPIPFFKIVMFCPGTTIVYPFV
jgi:hypothetical protein